jgi:hypothetical protein
LQVYLSQTGSKVRPVGKPYPLAPRQEEKMTEFSLRRSLLPAARQQAVPRTIAP